MSNRALPAVSSMPALDDLRELLPDWQRHLKAANKAKATIDSYARVAGEFLDFLIAQGMPTGASAVRREHIEHYLVHLQERPNKRTGKKLSDANTAKHYRSLQQLFRWLDEVEGEIESTPFAKMKPPAVPEQPVPVLSEAQLKALLATCKGKEFENVRDRALLLFFIDTGSRCGEVSPLKFSMDPEVSNFDFDSCVAHVMGKGRRGRAVPFSVVTAEALRRYFRQRARHPFAERTDAAWLGRKGALTESGIRRIIDRRADDAEIPHVYPHLFRHTFAHRWLVAGGQEQDLMRLAGWRSREMVGRYGASAADDRARSAHQRANLMEGLR